MDAIKEGMLASAKAAEAAVRLGERLLGQNTPNVMNFNSQICTSREQSERLLALGLKKETADCTLRKVSSKVYVIEAMPFCEYVDGIAEDYIGDSYIPAWSLHRLIEMMPENVTSDDWLGVSFDEVSYYHGEGEGMIGWKYYKIGDLYDCMIECYEWLIKEGYFNKEYLEGKK